MDYYEFSWIITISLEINNEENTEDSAVIQPILMKNRLPKREKGKEEHEDDIEQDISVRPEQVELFSIKNVFFNSYDFKTSLLHRVWVGLILTWQKVITS